MPTTVHTKARVRVVLDIDVGDSSWDAGQEPAYTRAFREAREACIGALNQVFSGERWRDRIKIVKVEEIELNVKERP